MCIPAKPPLNMVPSLVGPASHHILDGASQDVPIVGQASGKWGPIIEGEPEVVVRWLMVFMIQ